MFLHINPASKIPIYAQIVEQIKLQAISGMLSAGRDLSTLGKAKK